MDENTLDLPIIQVINGVTWRLTCINYDADGAEQSAYIFAKDTKDAEHRLGRLKSTGRLQDGVLVDVFHE